MILLTLMLRCVRLLGLPVEPRQGMLPSPALKAARWLAVMAAVIVLADGFVPRSFQGCRRSGSAVEKAVRQGRPSRTLLLPAKNRKKEADLERLFKLEQTESKRKDKKSKVDKGKPVRSKM
jgi:hypothetical protein